MLILFHPLADFISQHLILRQHNGKISKNLKKPLKILIRNLGWECDQKSCSLSLTNLNPSRVSERKERRKHQSTQR